MIITGHVSRRECWNFEQIRAEARAKIAAHHFYRATPESQVFTRLLTGLRARGIVREPEG